MGCSDAAELSVSIVGDRSIRKLNRDYLGKDRPTNVISFSLLEGDSGLIPASEALGDVVISADTAAREAAEAGITYPERLFFLLMHGILHLCGYDHERSGEAEAHRMDRKEQDIWCRLVAPAIAGTT